ncbi:BREX-1 system adenine-specific DNA-methyltransferase PglX [Komagataeibacter medellinensis]|uniref:site-specific DNA-methyltransferase (adenine-specific) n=1 Tax=Komagataeibacter medellinensis (strain NBRC 3288 / BCRC 11682 / LMG 1693 / Kondo 51) TaxID=634177 RepID=G2I569_KOMMN|nr:BREX-1 system adenine-specific DNA-methyltransferase PglX [Komagataeibacter medellinensis]BAK83266.1 hypothetical protein GLX_08540 [Komagataeibacter medellinensis NBRC 3288]
MTDPAGRARCGRESDDLMDTSALQRFAYAARIVLIDQVAVRLDRVLAEGATARRDHPGAIARLEAAVTKDRRQVVGQVACTWFNRFTALRFMDVTGLTHPRVVSPADGGIWPEILEQAMAGHLPDATCPDIARYLNGTQSPHDGRAEAYRRLLIHACTQWHALMPYLFASAHDPNRADDYTDLLMPDDLLLPDSILGRLRAVMTEEACQDVEIIGWLYQFYIREKKDQVFAGLKRNIRITAQDIPAATQLFTPRWIVRYLVENALGRLWMLNHPHAQLATRMAYYIAPDGPRIPFPRIERPEQIRLCDPACGAGHMLTYAFDLLHAIYEEAGYEATAIPALILTHNLTGIEIDGRAGALAMFALSMKAATRLGRQRFMHMKVKPDIVVLQDVTFSPAEMHDIATMVGRDLFTDALRGTLAQFGQAKNFGSLVVPELCNVGRVQQVVAAWDCGGNPVRNDLQVRVMTVLRMVQVLSPHYHVVVANPPYMGGKGMNETLGAFVKAHYPDSRSDLFAVFMERALGLCVEHGLMAMINMQSWMFLSSYEKLRDRLFANSVILSMAHLGERAFDNIGGAVVSTTAFVIGKVRGVNLEGTFIRLVDGGSEFEKRTRLRMAIENGACSWVYRASAEDFRKIPGSPIAYWLSEDFRRCFSRFPLIGDTAAVLCGMTTGRNARFVRKWHEISRERFLPHAASPEQAILSGQKWFPYAKGGAFRKWYGNAEHVVNWEAGGRDILASGRAYPRARNRYFSPSVSWSFLSSSYFGVRQQPQGFIFDMAGCSLFPDAPAHLPIYTGALCARTARLFLKAMNPTLNFQVNNVAAIPLPDTLAVDAIDRTVRAAVEIGKSDWDASETSWDFTILPLLSPAHRAGSVQGSYDRLRSCWQGMTDRMQQLEQENNRLFINAYGLHGEVAPEVPVEDITLTCNPAYRYGGKVRMVERERLLLYDTVAELLHYAVGCMFGRYSPDVPGLILASQGEGMDAYLARVPEPRFVPDRDNVIPVMDRNWFASDIVTYAHDFLRVTFGAAGFHENLAFIEKALGKDLRNWFIRDFYDYHVCRYRKRPIYWMFSSPGGSFNALIYMHRYRPDTVSVMLDRYVHEFMIRLDAERGLLERLVDNPTATYSKRARIQKAVGVVDRQIEELTRWVREVVVPMAQQKIAIDLDDGVRRNYPLFAGALKPIKGLEAPDG